MTIIPGGIIMIRINNSLIINAESPNEIKNVIIDDLDIITCGLSLKSSVTASSIDDSGFLYCIQRGFSTCGSDEIILPQEFKIGWDKKAEHIYPCLELVTLMLVSGKTPDEISENIYFYN